MPHFDFKEVDKVLDDLDKHPEKYPHIIHIEKSEPEQHVERPVQDPRFENKPWRP